MALFQSVRAILLFLTIGTFFFVWFEGFSAIFFTVLKIKDGSVEASSLLQKVSIALALALLIFSLAI